MAKRFLLQVCSPTCARPLHLYLERLTYEHSDDVIEQVVRDLDIWPILAFFSALCLVIATCISHTIASVLIVPIAAQIGNALEQPHPRLLIMVRIASSLAKHLCDNEAQATALICSAGMGLPVSGFPCVLGSVEKLKANPRTAT